jgi:hypothetical protein
VEVATVVLVAHLIYVFCSSLADEIIHVDLDRPEQNGGFFVFRITDVKASNGMELIDMIKIMLPHVVDLRDFSKYQAHLVLKGKALLIQQPTLPYYLLHEHEELLLTEKDKCVRTEQAHSVHANRVLEDSSRLVKSTLLVFPPGVLCSVDFTTAASATDGHKVKLYLRSLSTNSKLGTNDKETSQTFVPCYWLMRVLEDDRRLLKLDSAGTGGDTLEDAMQGMII